MKISKEILIIALPLSITGNEPPKISLSDRNEFQRIIKRGSINQFLNKLYSNDARSFPIDDEIIDIAHEHVENLQLRDEALRSNKQVLAIVLAICFENMLRCEKAAQAHDDH